MYYNKSRKDYITRDIIASKYKTIIIKICFDEKREREKEKERDNAVIIYTNILKYNIVYLQLAPSSDPSPQSFFLLHTASRGMHR